METKFIATFTDKTATYNMPTLRDRFLGYLHMASVGTRQNVHLVLIKI